MRSVETGTVLSFPAKALIGNGALACLRDTGLGEHFHFWRGASDHLYAVSVTTIGSTTDPGEAAASLPDFDGFVLIAVGRSGATRWPRFIVAVERGADRRAAVAASLAMGGCEWHVHLLGSDRAARAVIVDDLRARHGGQSRALSA